MIAAAGPARRAGVRTFGNLLVDHILLYVDDIADATASLVDGYGLCPYAVSAEDADAESVALGRDDIRIVLARPRSPSHPAAAYLDRHGYGVADIALGVADAAAAFDESVRHGARPVHPPAWHGDVMAATILGFGDVTHTFVQRPRRPGRDARALPGLRPVARPRPGNDTRLAAIDHFAVCVEAGRMAATAEFYTRVLDFAPVFTERIEIGDQAIETEAIQSRSKAVTFTLVEPDTSRPPGQIDDFLRDHGGPGVQHIALSTDDITAAVHAIGRGGVEFLDTPAAYYRLLARRMTPVRHPVAELERLGVLADEDHDGQLYQIFARSTHPRGTFFFEVIERMGAQTFGGGNITALYEAVEHRRLKDGAALAAGRAPSPRQRTTSGGARP